MRVRTAGWTIPQAQPDRPKWMPVGKHVGPVARKGQEGRRREGHHRPAPDDKVQVTDRRGARLAKTDA